VCVRCVRCVRGLLTLADPCVVWCANDTSPPEVIVATSSVWTQTGNVVIDGRISTRALPVRSAAAVVSCCLDCQPPDGSSLSLFLSVVWCGVCVCVCVHPLQEWGSLKAVGFKSGRLWRTSPVNQAAMVRSWLQRQWEGTERH
jgi:hypothetical protein